MTVPTLYVSLYYKFVKHIFPYLIDYICLRARSMRDDARLRYIGAVFVFSSALRVFLLFNSRAREERNCGDR